MKKTTKGAVAIGAGTLLLLGGGGTLAVWNATETVDGGTVYAGALELSDITEGTWYYPADAADPDAVDGDGLYELGDEFDPDADTVVPGDYLIYSVSDIDITALGNLFFTLDLGDFSGSTAFTVEGTEFAKTAGTLTLGTAPGDPEDYTPNGDALDVYSVSVSGITAGDAESATITVTVLVSFDADDAEQQYLAQSLTGADLILQQVVPAP